MVTSNERSKIPVVILCGGLGTRLREETEVRPKPMVEIGGRPILWHIMKTYSAHGLTEFILCLGYKGHMIKEYFLNYRAHSADLTVNLGMREAVRYHNSHPEEDWSVTLVDTGAQTQTGGRVARASKYVHGDTFCVTYGDGLADIDIGALLEFHRSHGRIGTVTGVRPPGRFGELRAGAAGEAVEFNEKPQLTDGIINGGFFVFDRQFLDHLSSREDLVLEQEPLQSLARERQLMIYQHQGFWQPMDTYRELKLIEDLWAGGKAPWKTWRDEA